LHIPFSETIIYYSSINYFKLAFLLIRFKSSTITVLF
jgi:hypothetical protein